MLIRQYNAMLPAFAKQERIGFADMSEAGITASDVAKDGVHPQPSGYRKIALVWAEALHRAGQPIINIPKPGTPRPNPSSRGSR